MLSKSFAVCEKGLRRIADDSQILYSILFNNFVLNVRDVQSSLLQVFLHQEKG